MRTSLSLAPLILSLVALPAAGQSARYQGGVGGLGPQARASQGVQRSRSPGASVGVGSPNYGGGYGTGYGRGFGGSYGPSYGGFGRTPSYGGFGDANLHRGRFPSGSFNTFVPSYGGFGFGGLGYGGLGYGYGYSAFGYGGLGYGYGLPYYGGGVPPLVVSIPPTVNYVTPEVYQPLGPDYGPGYGPAGPVDPLLADPLLADTAREADRRWNGPVDAGDPPPPELVQPSSPQAVAEALEAERRGDEWFRRVEYGKAYGEYRRAVAVAPDRGPSRFRKGYALAALNEYERAVFEFRRGLELDPSLPTTGPTLVEMFGEGNDIARTAFIGRIARYAREDVRDPTRLFLLGVVMHAAGDPRAAEVFEAAWRLGGDSAGVAAYLNPVEVRDGVPVEPEPVEPEPIEPAPGDVDIPPLPAPDAGGDAEEDATPPDGPPPGFTPPNVAPTDISP